jgi:hypothetical protein
MTDGVLAAFEPILVRMGEHGWSRQETMAMEVHEVARWLGDEDFDPVIRGQRGPLRVGRDLDDAPKGRGKGSRFGRFNPRRAKRDPGRIFYGSDAA